jgi:uncharacterized protein
MLKRLTFNITQCCNLSCRYCYASMGKYGGISSKLSPDIAVVKLREVAEAFSIIRLIQFIGGEPLLNYNAIQVICEEIKVLIKQGILNQLPKLSIVTNLTILDSLMIKILKEFEIYVIVSLDGPSMIHDKLRLTTNNEPTHKIIIQNLEKLISEKIPYEIEATFTNVHLEHNLSIVDLIKYFSTWNPRKIHITPVMTNKENEIGFFADNSWQKVIELEIEALNYVFDELEKNIFVPYGLLIEILSILDSSELTHFCPAGISNIAISSDGNLFACHMFTNNLKYQIKNKILASMKLLSYSIPSKKDFMGCLTCWAKKWCKVCLGRMEYIFPGTPKPIIEQCEKTKRTIELVMQRIPKINMMI